jgi:XTP/dITP diphosphohydrolase
MFLRAGEIRMKLLIATGNRHKLREIKMLFDIPGVEIMGLADFGDLPEVVEDGDSFEANAIKKAVTMAEATGVLTMADDSGLEVDALAGAPGVYSARYAGEPTDDAANNRKLLSELAGVEDRQARFRCLIALAGPGIKPLTVEGRCEGAIARSPSGENGFGYDPLFVPKGFGCSFAELSDDEKNRISHRGVALAEARIAFAGYFVM